MSQEKVNRYKEEKANRKQLMEKQKKQKALRKVAGIVIAVVLIGWVGYSAVDAYQESRPRDVVEVDYTVVDEYLQTIAEQSEIKYNELLIVILIKKIMLLIEYW